MILKKKHKKANLRDLIAATSQVILLKLDSIFFIFRPVGPWNWMDELSYQSGNSKFKFGSKSAIFCPVWPWNLRLFNGGGGGGGGGGRRRTLWPPTVSRLAARSSQSNPRGPGGLGQRCWNVSKVTWLLNLEFRRWGSLGPSSLMMTLKNNRAPLLCHIKL